MANNKKVTVQLDIEAQIGQAKKSIENLSSSLAKIGTNKGLKENLIKELKAVESEFAKLGNINFDKMDSKSLERVQNIIDMINKKTNDLKGTVKGIDFSNFKEVLPRDLVDNINRATNSLKEYEKTIQKESNTTQQNLADENKKLIKLKQTRDQLVKAQKTGDYSQVNGKGFTDSAKRDLQINEQKLAILTKIVAKQQDLAKAEKLYQQNENESNKKALSSAKGQLTKAINQGKGIGLDISAIKNVEAEINKLNNEINKTKNNFNFNASGKIIELNNEIKNSERFITELKNKLSQISPDAFKVLKEQLKDINGLDLTDIDSFKRSLKELPVAQVEKIKQSVSELAPDLESIDDAARKAQVGLHGTFEELEQISLQQQNIEQLRQRLTALFSMDQMINVFRRAIRDAFDTVKELDATMTETAVVSDETVGSMWTHIDEYTAEANKLGVAINDVIGAQTLYVQQGLDLNISLGMATETMKMARIAGMEAKDATDAMTAAIRGFGMAINGVSAERINDVYSNLAALTASDTQELATAMSKVASIAHSANMEFENTAAFLAQIIN